MSDTQNPFIAGPPPNPLPTPTPFSPPPFWVGPGPQMDDIHINRDMTQNWQFSPNNPINMAPAQQAEIEKQNAAWSNSQHS